MTARYRLLAALLGLALLLPAAARAASGSLPVYVPPDVGAPATRVAAATRGAGPGTAEVWPLAPDATGLTAHAAPRLYWYLSEPFQGPIELTLIAEDGMDPLAEIRLEHGAAAGIHAFDLGAAKVTLEPGRDYRWSVALVLDPASRSADAFAAATIRRVPGDATGDATSLARAGLWYDALQAAAAPAERAALLDQVGLAAAASWQRGQRG